MKFSTFHLYPQPQGWAVSDVYAYETQVIKWADELGFDTAWVAEHHFRDYGVVPSTMLLFANLAAQTKRIRLGNAILIMPFHHPLRVAEDAAMVDILSGGRFNFGFGRGYQGVEFTGFGVSMDDTRSKTDEAVDIVLKAWEGKPFSYHGKHYTVDNVQVVPAPVQKPHPPLCFASISPDSIRHYAKRGIGFMVDGSATFPKLREAIAEWRRIAKEHGHDPDASDIIAQRQVYLADTNKQAKEFVQGTNMLLPWAPAYDPKNAPTTPVAQYARESAPIDPKTGKVAKGYEYWEKGYLGRTVSEWSLSSEEAWEQRWVAGDIDRVIGKIKELEAMGLKNLMCAFAAQAGHARPPLPEVYKRMERFARDVMPHFQPVRKK